VCTIYNIPTKFTSGGLHEKHVGLHEKHVGLHEKHVGLHEKHVCNVKRNKLYAKLKSNFANPINGQLY
jgi:hypothetical protein